MALDQYYPLGRSGLRVSRLALGTMNFGTDGYHAAYGKTMDEARPILRRYLDSGGNFIDTADFYTAGQSETIIGELLAEAKTRYRVVLTTKFTRSDASQPRSTVARRSARAARRNTVRSRNPPVAQAENKQRVR